jgi:hypothetical protein
VVWSVKNPTRQETQLAYPEPLAIPRVMDKAICWNRGNYDLRIVNERQPETQQQFALRAKQAGAGSETLNYLMKRVVSPDLTHKVVSVESMLDEIGSFEQLWSMSSNELSDQLKSYRDMNSFTPQQYEQVLRTKAVIDDVRAMGDGQKMKQDESTWKVLQEGFNSLTHNGKDFHYYSLVRNFIPGNFPDAMEELNKSNERGGWIELKLLEPLIQKVGVEGDSTHIERKWLVDLVDNVIDNPAQANQILQNTDVNTVLGNAGLLQRFQQLVDYGLSLQGWLKTEKDAGFPPKIPANEWGADVATRKNSEINQKCGMITMENSRILLEQMQFSSLSKFVVEAITSKSYSRSGLGENLANRIFEKVLIDQYLPRE